MPGFKALEACPDLIIMPVRFDVYREESRRVREIFGRFTDLIEPLSLDEAYLDISHLNSTGRAVAWEIRNQIREETGLTASAGIAGNKMLAKIASDWDKPDGLTIVTAANRRRILDPLPVQVIPGIGPETLKHLQRADIISIADLRQAPDKILEPIFGRFAQRTRQRASGIDERPVVAARSDKSISAEETFDQDLTHVNDMHRELLRLTERTSRRLRAKQLSAGTVQVKIRKGDFSTFTRQRVMQPPANSTDSLYETAKDLLAIWLQENPGSSIRLLGVGGSALGVADQGDLFAPQTSSRGTQLDQTADQIRDRFGDIALSRARSLDGD
jgi:DNA polymerase-4